VVVVEKVVPQVFVVVVLSEIGHRERLPLLPSPVDDTFLDLHALRQTAAMLAA
jgi:hypothetical protein